MSIFFFSFFFFSFCLCFVGFGVVGFLGFFFYVPTFFASFLPPLPPLKDEPGKMPRPQGGEDPPPGSSRCPASPRPTKAEADPHQPGALLSPSENTGAWGEGGGWGGSKRPHGRRLAAAKNYLKKKKKEKKNPNDVAGSRWKSATPSLSRRRGREKGKAAMQGIANPNAPPRRASGAGFIPPSRQAPPGGRQHRREGKGKLREAAGGQAGGGPDDSGMQGPAGNSVRLGKAHTPPPFPSGETPPKASLPPLAWWEEMREGVSPRGCWRRRGAGRARPPSCCPRRDTRGGTRQR